MVGTGETEMEDIRGASRLFTMYIGKLEEKTKETSIIKHIKKKTNIEPKECEKLECKIAGCSSFKVVVLEQEARILLNSDIWPTNVVCRRFFFPRAVEHNNIQND